MCVRNDTRDRDITSPVGAGRLTGGGGGAIGVLGGKGRPWSPNIAAVAASTDAGSVYGPARVTFVLDVACESTENSVSNRSAATLRGMDAWTRRACATVCEMP